MRASARAGSSFELARLAESVETLRAGSGRRLALSAVSVRFGRASARSVRSARLGACFGTRRGTCLQAGRVHGASCAEEQRTLRRAVAFSSSKLVRARAGEGKRGRGQVRFVRGARSQESQASATGRPGVNALKGQGKPTRGAAQSYPTGRAEEQEHREAVERHAGSARAKRGATLLRNTLQGTRTS